MASSELESRISSEACELLDCFSAEVGNAVCDLAEDLARKRAMERSAPIQIEQEDVRRAGEIVLEYLQKAIKKGDLPLRLEPAVQGMSACFEQKTR